MLNTLRGEFVKRGLDPVKAVVQTIDCSEKTARNKLNGCTPFTIPEAAKIVKRHFGVNCDIFELFANSDGQRAS